MNFRFQLVEKNLQPVMYGKLVNFKREQYILKWIRNI